MVYIRLEHKSSHISKYSQPLELILFHIIKVSINCHKGFYYPHLIKFIFIYLFKLVALTSYLFLLHEKRGIHQINAILNIMMFRMESILGCLLLDS